MSLHSGLYVDIQEVGTAGLLYSSPNKNMEKLLLYFIPIRKWKEASLYILPTH